MRYSSETEAWGLYCEAMNLKAQEIDSSITLGKQATERVHSISFERMAEYQDKKNITEHPTVYLTIIITFKDIIRIVKEYLNKVARVL